MSDLKARNSDRLSPPRSRIKPKNRLARDRGLRFSDLTLAVLVFATGCVLAPHPVRAPEVPRPELWVDGFSPLGGDGSRERPFKQVPQPVPRGVTVRLRTGIYAAPFVLSEDARLEGVGEVVLTGEEGVTVVTAQGASLENLSVQGGAIGLEAGRGVRLKKVHFSGQRQKAAVVHGTLTMSQSTLEASVEGIDGIGVDRGASLELSQVKFTGGFRRAVQSEGGTLSLRQVTAEGPKTLVNAIGAQSQLEDVRSSLGSGIALFFSGGHASLKGVEVVGQEYAVALFGGVEAELRDVKARGAAQACISAIASKLTLSNSSLSGCGPGGALTLQKSTTVLKGVKIDAAKEVGIFVKGGSLELNSVSISKVAGSPDGSLGDALHIRDEAHISGQGTTTVTDADGSALFVSAFSQVRLQSVSVERAKNSALFVERHAEVVIESLLVRGGSGPAIVVPDEATVRVGSLFVAGGNEMPVYAECRAGAQVFLGRLESTLQQLPSQCVSLPKK